MPALSDSLLPDPRHLVSYAALGLPLRSAVSFKGVWRGSGPERPVYQVTVVRRGVLDRHLKGLAPVAEYSSDNVEIFELDELVFFRYTDGTHFLVDSKRKVIEFCWDADSSSLEDACTYLTGPVLGLAACLEGFGCFHGAAVIVDQSAVLILAASEAGKSTSAAAFALGGYDVLSDDVGAIWQEHGLLTVAPAFPVVRLWPAAVELLFGSVDALPLLTPNWDKRYLSLEDMGRFRSTAAPLACVVLLDPGIGAETTKAERLEGARAVVAIVSNSYPQTFRTRKIDAKNFEIASEIARRMPVLKLPAYLPPGEIVRRIVEARRSLG